MINGRCIGTVNIVLTNTHVLAFHNFTSPEAQTRIIVVQAFTASNKDQFTIDGYPTLHLSHEGIISQINDFPEALIQNSKVDHITGSINIKFLHHWSHSYGLHSKCIDMTLHKSSPTVVSPITTQLHPVITTEIGLPNQDKRYCANFFTLSGDGHGRGFFAKCLEQSGSPEFEIRKFTINVSPDSGHCTAVLHQFSPLMLSREHQQEWTHCHVQFDGLVGRICYVLFKGQDDESLVIIDVE